MNSFHQADKLFDYLMKQLTEKEKREFEKHLESCQACRRELQVERAIESELSAELQPGFIENRIRARLQVRQARDMRSLWMYVFRMVVYGITAAIVGVIILPFLLKLPLTSSTGLGKYASAATELLSQIAPVNTFFIMFGICYIAVFLASVYSLAQIRR